MFLDDVRCILNGVIDLTNVKSPSAVPHYFYRNDFVGANFQPIVLNETLKKEAIISVQENVYDKTLVVSSNINQFIVPGESVILTADKIVSDYDTFTLSDNEVVISYELFTSLFNSNSKWFYISATLDQIRQVPEVIGKTFDLNFLEAKSLEQIASYKIKIAGISFSKDFALDSLKNQMAVSNLFEVTLNNDLTVNDILIKSSSVKNLTAFERGLKNHQSYIKNVGTVLSKEESIDEKYIDVADLINGFSEVIKLVSGIFMFIGAILTVMLVLIVINLISFSVINRKNEIGILTALGTSKKRYHKHFCA